MHRGLTGRRALGTSIVVATMALVACNALTGLDDLREVACPRGCAGATV